MKYTTAIAPIIDNRARAHLLKLVTEMVNERGQRQTAYLVKFNPGTINHILNSRWKQVAIYPEMITAVEVAHAVVMRETKLTGEAKLVAEELTRQCGEFATTVRRLRRILRKI